MEACFLTSSSFPTTAELAPSVKARLFSCPRNKIPQQFLSKKVGRQSSTITCCHVPSSSSSSNDENKAYVGTDWRSFRARLIGIEQATRPIDQSTIRDPDGILDLDSPSQIIIGEKWAHTLHEPEKGCLLIATEKLDGVHIFERTVILLLSMGPAGPFGIILNRSSLMSIKEMRSAVVDTWVGTFSDKPLFFGGPLEEGLFLVNPKGGYDVDRVGKSGVFEEVMHGLYYGTKESVGCAAEMVKRNVVGIGDFRFFDGYCGWEKEQLREEINAGYWRVGACSSSVIGVGSGGRLGLWEEVQYLMSPKKVW